MNITVANLSSTVTKAQSAKLPGVLKDSYTDVVEMLDLYNDDSDIKKYIDTYVSKLNQHYSKSAAQEKPKAPDKPQRPAKKYKKGFKWVDGDEFEIIDNGESSPIDDGYDYHVRNNTKKTTIYLHESRIDESVEHAKIEPSITVKSKDNNKRLILTRAKGVRFTNMNLRETQKYWVRPVIPISKEMYDRIFKFASNPETDWLQNKAGNRYTFGEVDGGWALLPHKDNKKIEAPPKKKVTATTTKKPVTNTATQVAEVALEVRFIKRYMSWDGKKKTRKQLLAFISTLQRAIEKKQIRKTSKYATEIRHIQKELVNIANDEGVSNSFTFQLDATDKKVIAKFTKIATSQQQRTSVRLISRFIGIHGRTAVKEKAERLLKAIKSAFKNKTIQANDPYRKQVKEVQGNLVKYINAHESKLQIGVSELKGLQGIAGLMEQDGNVKAGDKVELPFGGRDTVTKVTDKAVFLKKHKGLVNKKFVKKLNGIPETGVMSSVDVAKMEHHPCGFTGKWLQLIGDPVSPFKMMFWSKPGMGKSSLAIELAKYIADKFNKQILYVSVEEGYAYTIQEKFNRLNAVHPNIAIAPEMPNCLKPYNIIFIDSVTYMNMTVDDFQALKTRYPDKSFVLIFQATVDGNYRGSKEWEHEVDVSIYINENGYAKASKTRFGGNGTIKVFKGEPDQIYKFTHLQDAERYVSKSDKPLRILNGDDGKKWVTNPDKAKELAKQGYEIY